MVSGASQWQSAGDAAGGGDGVSRMEENIALVHIEAPGNSYFPGASSMLARGVPRFGLTRSVC